MNLPNIAFPTFEGDTCSWLHLRDTFDALIVNNTTLSNVQKFHYVIASLENEAKVLINNLEMTNKNFLFAWQLVTQRYNNKRLIAMLRIDSQIQSINDKGSPNNGPAHARRSSTAEFNTYYSFKRKPRNHILLATAIVEVQNKFGQCVPCRALLDSASQSHFITE